MSHRRPILAATFLALLAAPRGQAQSAPAADVPGARVTVDAVLVDVVVVDAEGHPVTGLTAKDFVVHENGRPMTLTDFEEHRLAARGAAAVADAPASATGDPAAAAGAGPGPGATFILLFDELGTTPHAMERARKAAVAFLQGSVRPEDRVSLYRYDGYLRLVKALTTDHALLAGLLSAERGEGAWSRELPRSNAMSRSAALALLASLHDDVPGRKTLLSFGRSIGGDGLDGDELEAAEESDDESNAPEGDVDAALLAGYERVIAAMSAANVAVFPVDPDGALATPADARQGGAPRARASGYGAAGGRDPRPRQGRGMGERRAPTSRGGIAPGALAIDAFATSKMLADDTGGEAVIYGEGLDAKLRHVAELAGAYYLLGYTPPAEGRAFRKLTIEVTREGVRVLARKGYYAGFEGGGAELGLP